LTGTAPSGGVLPSSASAARALVTLTHDQKLLEVLRAAAEPQHPLNSVGSEVDLATALMTHTCGVVVLDAAALATPIAQLAARINTQFPDLVLLAAGGLNDQGALAQLIADGTVYRFLHKPVSEQRVKLFVGAAWRRREEALAAARAAASTSAPRGKSRALQGALVAIAAVAAAGAALVAWHVLHEPSASGAPATGNTTAAASAGDAALETLLARADHALDTGALVEPPGENAAQLYAEALRRSARDPRAARGLEEVIDKLLGAADEQLRAGQLDAAQRLCDQARAVNPEHPRTAFLAAQIGAQRERAVLAQAQRAAAHGDLGRALAVLDKAARDVAPSTLATEARAELARQQVDARVADFLKRGRDALDAGALVEPTEQNARFYIESALALAPGNPDVQQARQELLTRLLAEGSKALAAGNHPLAQHWLEAARAAGADGAAVDALEVQISTAQPEAQAAAAQAPTPQADSAEAASR
jgi:hypothetical protein